VLTLPRVNAQPSILATDLAGVTLVNPVMLAAGTCGTLDEMGEVIDLSRIGGVVTKSITARPREGNAFPRVIDARAGMLNAIGLANVGVKHFVEHMGPRAGQVPTRVIGSIAGFSIDDYVTVAALMDDEKGIEAVELNVSCPNVNGGTEFGADPISLAELVGAVRPVLASTRLLVKLSPIAVGLPGMTAVARAAVQGAGVPGGPNGRPGADGLCVANTIPAMAIDVVSRTPRLANTTGGLSGPAIHAVAVKLVYDVYRGAARAEGVPVVGVGGVMRWEDAAEFILAGASAVAMGTALFADPRSPLRVVRGLERWVRRQGAGHVSELVGQVRV
jgi:dihydroorotate dehydrogenase (NAD+) catalytic subunit